MSRLSEYAGKRFSVFGDSISTLSGYSEPFDAAFYEGARKIEADVYAPEDTWWGGVIDRLHGERFVNHSVSGCTVTYDPRYCIPSYGCSEVRVSSLRKNGCDPDVIMIFMGINDWGCGVRLTPRSAEEADDPGVFSVAYRKMLDALRRCYPKAEIWCLTIPVSLCSRRSDFVFPYRYGGWHLNEFCAEIRSAAAQYGCRLIDLYAASVPHDTIDGFHPNRDGMQTIADTVIKALEEETE